MLAEIETYSVYLALFLLFFYAASQDWKCHWLAGIFAHFKLQYAIGGAILCITHLWFENYILALPMLGIALCAYIETRLPLNNPWQFKPPEGQPQLRIMQYNKFYKTRPYDRLKKYLAENTDIDFIVMQEAEDIDIEPLRQIFSPTHPHMLPLESERPNYVFIASKYPLQNLEMKLMPETGTKAIRFELNIPVLNTPLVIYTIHAEMPFGKMATVQYAELQGIAEWIAEDKNENIICMGDWNATPYMPAYHKLLEISDLRYQFFGLIPVGTWPSFLLLPILRIPIDHILFKGRLALLKSQKGPSFRSDHHSLHSWLVFEK